MVLVHGIVRIIVSALGRFLILVIVIDIVAVSVMVIVVTCRS